MRGDKSLPSPMLASSDASADLTGPDAWPLELVGASLLARRAREQVQEAASRDRVLVVVEPGLDAERVARTIHRLGSPAEAPFVVIDCAAPGGVIDEILFGRPAGAGGRRSEQVTRLEPGSQLAAAIGGTLLLANVLDLPASTQARLARMARDGQVRLARGERAAVPFGARIVASAGPSIDREVADGAFRADLVRRLAGIRIDVPPLRFRPEDIAILTRQALVELGDGSGASGRRFTGAALGFLSALPWTGNLQELREALVRLLKVSPGRPIRVEDLVEQVRFERLAPMKLGSLREARRQFEREYITAVLREHGWRMGEAARALGIERTNLYRKARQLNIPCAKMTRSSC